MATGLVWCSARRPVAESRDRRRDLAAAFPAPGTRSRSPAARRYALAGSNALGAREAPVTAWRRKRPARVYRACGDRRAALRPCTLGTCWERFY